MMQQRPSILMQLNPLRGITNNPGKVLNLAIIVAIIMLVTNGYKAIMKNGLISSIFGTQRTDDERQKEEDQTTSVIQQLSNNVSTSSTTNAKSQYQVVANDVLNLMHGYLSNEVAIMKRLGDFCKTKNDLLLVIDNFGNHGVADISYSFTFSSLSTRKTFWQALRDECSPPESAWFISYSDEYITNYNKIMSFLNALKL
jgi:hypothetical protein